MTEIYFLVGIAALVLQIFIIIKFFQMASDVRKLSRINARHYIDIAEMEAYVGNKSIAIENYKRAKFRYEFKEKYMTNNDTDKTAEKIAEIDNLIETLKS